MTGARFWSEFQPGGRASGLVLPPPRSEAAPTPPPLGAVHRPPPPPSSDKYRRGGREAAPGVVAKATGSSGSLKDGSGQRVPFALRKGPGSVSGRGHLSVIPETSFPFCFVVAAGPGAVRSPWQEAPARRDRRLRGCPARQRRAHRGPCGRGYSLAWEAGPPTDLNSGASLCTAGPEGFGSICKSSKQCSTGPIAPRRSRSVRAVK